MEIDNIKRMINGGDKELRELGMILFYAKTGFSKPDNWKYNTSYVNHCITIYQKRWRSYQKKKHDKRTIGQDRLNAKE